MDIQSIMKIFDDTAYVRMGGSPEELKAAQYLADQCAAFGAEAHLEFFPVQMANLQEATLTVDGETITCKGYLNAGCGDVVAPLYYLRGTDPYSLSGCKGKIVLVDGYLGYWVYQDLLENRMPKALALILGLAGCYTCGTLWYYYSYLGSAGSFLPALAQCVLPFLFPDALKLWVAWNLARRIRRLTG